MIFIFFFTSVFATIGWGILSINDDSSEFYEDILSGIYDHMSLFEISINGQNGPLAIWFWIRLYQIFNFLNFGNSPMIGVYFNIVLNTVAYLYYFKLMTEIGKNEYVTFSKSLFLFLFFFSGVNLLLGTSHYRDSMLLMIIAYHCYHSYKFSNFEKKLFYYLFITLIVFYCTFWLRTSYVIIPFIIFSISFLKRYWVRKIIIFTFLFLAVFLAIIILNMPNYTVLQEVSSRSEDIVEEAGMSRLLFQANFLIKIFLYPIYFFSYPFPLSSFFNQIPRLGDLMRFFNALFLISIFPFSLVKMFSFAIEYKKRASVFFLLGIYLICLYAILFSSFEFRHTAPFFPLLFIILSDMSLKKYKNLNKVISLIWFILIFILNVIAYFFN